MQNIVIITVGITSHLNACFKITHQLGQDGYRITFVSPDKRAREQVEAQGYPFFHLEEKAAALQHLNKRSQWFATIPALRTLGQSSWVAKILSVIDRKSKLEAEKARRQYILESTELDRLFGQIRPDLLLIDYELHDHIIGTGRFRIPTLLLEYHCSTRKAPNVPILYSNLIPTQTVWNSLKIEAGWRFTFMTRQLKYTFWRNYLNKNDWFSTLQDLARRDSFAFDKRVDFLNHWHYLTYRDIPTLRLSAWEFDFPHVVSDKEEYVGPMVHFERQEPLVDAHYQQVMQDLDARRQAGGGKTRTVVFCSMGTLISDYDYFERVIEAFAGKSSWDLILATGRGIPNAYESTAANVYLFKRVPQLDALRRADVFLTHGGIGSIHEAILLGVPMIVYSGGVMDENGNAARVEYHRLGLRGNLKNDSPAQIEGRIEAVLANPDYKTNVCKMRDTFLAYNRAGRTALIIEELLKKPTPIRRGRSCGGI